MRKLIFALAVLAFFACSKDTLNENVAGPEAEGQAVMVNTPEGAVAGRLSVKLSEAVANKLEEVLKMKTRAGEMATRSGISEMDVVFDKIGVEHFSRIFPYEPRFEERHRAAGLHLWYNVTFAQESDLRQAAQLLGQVEGVKVVEFTHPIEPACEGPAIPCNIERTATRAEMPMNDPGLEKQWHYNNPGTAGVHFKAGADISLFDAWEMTAGSPEIIVAVIDEPVQTTHADIKENLWTNPNPGYVGVNGKAYNNDIHGFNFYNDTDELDWKTPAYNEQYRAWFYSDHGSHVAGTIAAVNNNGEGVCGIAGGDGTTGGVKIMSCQILGNNERNAHLDASVRAFVYAADRGALIAQCSWGYSAAVNSYNMWVGMDKGVERNAIDYFIENAGRDNPNSPLKGGLVVFAAGNDGHLVKDQKIWPAAYPNVVSVASIGPDYLPAYYTDYGKWVSVTAPGGDASYGDETQVLSLILDDESIDYKDGRKAGYGYMQGTSMACPHVSGMAALALSRAAKLGKQFTVEEFVSMMMTSCENIDGKFEGTKNLSGLGLQLDMTQYRGKMGAGRLDAYKLLLNVDGIPSVCVKMGTDAEVNLDKLFSGRVNALDVNVKVESDVAEKLGMTAYSVENGKFKVHCTKVGGGIVSFETKMNGKIVKTNLAIISRTSVPENGLWL